MYSNTISLRYLFPPARILNEIAEFEKMPLNRKTLIGNGEFEKHLVEHYPDQRSSLRDLNNKI